MNAPIIVLHSRKILIHFRNNKPSTVSETSTIPHSMFPFLPSYASNAPSTSPSQFTLPSHNQTVWFPKTVACCSFSESMWRIHGDHCCLDLLLSSKQNYPQSLPLPISCLFIESRICEEDGTGSPLFPWNTNGVGVKKRAGTKLIITRGCEVIIDTSLFLILWLPNSGKTTLSETNDHRNDSLSAVSSPDLSLSQCNLAPTIERCCAPRGLATLSAVLFTVQTRSTVPSFSVSFWLNCTWTKKTITRWMEWVDTRWNEKRKCKIGENLIIWPWKRTIVIGCQCASDTDHYLVIWR